MFSQKKSILNGKLFFIVLAVLFIFGYVLDKDDLSKVKNMYTGNKNQNETQVQGQDQNQTDKTQPASQNESVKAYKINANTKLLLRVYDKNSNDVKTEELELPQDVINLPFDAARDYISKQYKDYTIGEINENYILMYKNVTDSMSEGESSQIGKSSPYYLLKADGGTVNIYYFDENGKEKLVKQTNIVFDLLSESDQQLFKNGIKKATMDEVNQLLQDFDS